MDIRSGNDRAEWPSAEASGPSAAFENVCFRRGRFSGLIGDFSMAKRHRCARWPRSLICNAFEPAADQATSLDPAAAH